MHKHTFFNLSCTAFLLCARASLKAQTILNVSASTDNNVSTGGAPGELRYALNTMLNAQAQGTSSGDWQVNFNNSGTIVLNGTLPMINLFSADTVSFNSTGTAVTI